MTHGTTNSSRKEQLATSISCCWSFQRSRNDFVNLLAYKHNIQTVNLMPKTSGKWSQLETPVKPFSSNQQSNAVTNNFWQLYCFGNKCSVSLGKVMGKYPYFWKPGPPLTKCRSCSKNYLNPFSCLGIIYTRIEWNSNFYTSPDFQALLKIIKMLIYWPKMTNHKKW